MKVFSEFFQDYTARHVGGSEPGRATFRAFIDFSHAHEVEAGSICAHAMNNPNPVTHDRVSRFFLETQSH